eukprot:CAMPEP_0201679358 /NCGR_PEP_ID=MMETSP0494-20130426/48263_1 /ASSEMBLY_ACC=CAM_ASM_000839 /TAXON_ID=420259 /ORGANISM="Thalassiosira gravida, Strain GMp14c1" /LENGTH=595 /DNA_ID=CAMNT_0048162831 /DNA_START=113 /DNA_END=1900 /DNA_ORIENTATION=-
MKRRIAPNLLVLCAAAISGGASATSWLEELHLRVRQDMEHELNFISSEEYAPPPPTEELFRRTLQSVHGQGVMAREQGKGGNSNGGNSNGGVMNRNSNTRNNNNNNNNDRGEGCSSPLIKWTTSQVRSMGYHAYKTLHDNKIIQMAYVYKHYIDRNQEEEYFINDIQTAELRKRHRDTIAFWSDADIDNTIVTDNVLLLSMHGKDLEEDDKLVPTILRMFDFDDMNEVLEFAAKVQRLIADLPRGYDNPLLTMNAIATRSTYNYGTYGGHDDPSRRTKDSIIIGDGVLEFLIESGLESSGPDFVHAHEFGHHLQFQIVDDLISSERPNEASFKDDDRKKELMADAIGGYFLAHDRGGDMIAREIGVFERTAFSTGDCSTDQEDHHGTPAQRECAAVWGASTAARAEERGEFVLDAEVFVNAFHDAYGGILGLGREECTLVLEGVSSVDVTSIDSPLQENEDEEVEEEWSTSEDEEQNELTTAGNVIDQEEEDSGDFQEGDREPGVSLQEWLDSIEENNRHNTGSRGQPSQVSPPDDQEADASTQPGSNPPMRHGVTMKDCHQPWVHCEASSGYIGFAGWSLYTVSAAMTVALLIY